MTFNPGAGSAGPHAGYQAQAAQHFGMQGSPHVQGAPEHQQIALLPGEEAVFSADFTAFPILRHIKTGLVVTGHRVITRHPQYVLGFFRVGHNEAACPIGKISMVRVGRTMSRTRLLQAAIFGGIGVMVLMSGLGSMAYSPATGMLMVLVGLPAIAAAAFFLWLARSLALTVSSDSGGLLHVDVDKVQYQGMVIAGQLIQQLMLGAVPAAPTDAAGTPQGASAPIPRPNHY